MAISKPELIALRYVNGQPDPDQRPDQARVQWIKNNEPSTGATSEFTSDGVFNRPVAQVQDNALTLYVNAYNLKTCVDELVDTVNELTGDAGANFGERIQALESWRTTATQEINSLTFKIGQDGTVEGQSKTGLYADIQHLRDGQGFRASLDVRNPMVPSDSVRDDLWFIKGTVIGNKRNYDPNGNYNPDEYGTASGIFAETEQLRSSTTQLNGSVNQLNDRVVALEEASDVGAVEDLRADMGSRTDPDYTPGSTVFARLGSLELSTSNLGQVQTQQGDSLVDHTGRIEQLESSSVTVNNTLTAHSQELTTIDQTIGTWEASRGTIANFTMITRNDLTNLKAIVGTGAWATEPASIRYILNDVVVQLGDQGTSAAGDGTLWGYVNTYLKNTAPGSLTHTANRVTAVEQELDLSTLTGVTDKSSLLAVLQEVVNRIQALEAI
ncbi:fibritin neck whisker [Vibrio phage EniLVp02]